MQPSASSAPYGLLELCRSIPMKPAIACTAILVSMWASLEGRTSVPDMNSLNWYRCNTHTHTSARPNSDANATPEFVAEWYRSHGYQCLVITDHEFLTDVEPLNRKYEK